ncbi:MFS general substrate transporter [Eremomyces bilateralis CBS 781.70]|uniref:MFS general substrate transporter n=1 Tax=Eremomyces bilateralis CBS 781.70 TaxID=1392243 RepID=A0A6G1GEZ0_9PEZI|nr:MFS general substrate transporter [Eremomyces bilateralis CBS 781.70]KAF1816613.1 MFS general substrate transporter [Eremomyces bilateralis CBS 781.70]
MSLSQRVSALEEYDLWREISPSGGQRRKLSFNPVDNWVPPLLQEELEPIGAFEVSTTKRIAQVIVAVIYCLFAAGIVFGYAAIKPVLIQEGVYRETCSKDELDRGVHVCYEQELRLNFMFTIAAVSTNVVALPVGTILDRYGPRVAGIIGSLFVYLGCLFFAFAGQLPFDGYIPSYLFLALGGPFIFISSFQLSNTFPRYSGLILALLTGAFDSSSAIFLFYRLIYQATHARFWPKYFFLAYLLVPTFILVVQIFLMPSASYKTVGELVSDAETGAEADAHESDGDIEDESERQLLQDERRHRRESVIEEVTALLGTVDADEQNQKEEAKKHNSGVWGALHGRTAAQQMATPWFVLITLFTVIQMTRINYFVATIRPQYEHLLGDERKAVAVNTFFDVALPLGGVVAVPFIGWFLDNLSTPTVLAVLVTTATTIGVLGVLPHMWASYANVCLFVLYRPFYYTAVSDYAAKVFGFATFGKVYGTIICLAGLLNFSQSGLEALTHRVFHHDPVPVNLLLLGTALVVGIALVGYVAAKSRETGLEILRREAREAQETERLMPSVEVGQGEGRGRGYGTANGTANGRG